MFTYLNKKINYLKNSSNHANEEKKKTPLSKSLQTNIEHMKQILGNSPDIVYRFIDISNDESKRACIVYVDGLVDSMFISQNVMQPIMNFNDDISGDIISFIDKKISYAIKTKTTTYLEDCITEVLNGNTALIIDDNDKVLSIDTKGWEKRAITEPLTDTVVRGPRDAFTENIITNTTLIRRRIKSDKLRIESKVIGTKTQTAVMIVYLDDVVNKDVLRRVRSRLDKIYTDAIFESSYIEQYIDDAPFSPFSTISYTEKPEVVCANIMEGRVAIVVDCTPIVITVPMLFIEGFQSAEDYYVRPIYASCLRLIRYIGYFLTVSTPALFIALTSYHKELIPTNLLLTIIKASENTPFPMFLEVIGMLLAFEIIKEAGIRMPKPVGQSVSIVGALIMGEAAVSAGIVGAPTVIAIAMTAVSGFLIPHKNESTFILRWILIILSSVLGLYGYAVGVFLIMVHLATLTSFGVTFFSGFVNPSLQKDTIIRAPIWLFRKRPTNIALENQTRQKYRKSIFRPYADEDKNAEDEKNEL